MLTTGCHYRAVLQIVVVILENGSHLATVANNPGLARHVSSVRRIRRDAGCRPKLIPRWFHEGTAQRYEVDGHARIGMRTINRVRTWLSNDEFLAEDRFCAKRFNPRDAREQSIFYRTSLEFTRHLDTKTRHGKRQPTGRRRSPWAKVRVQYATEDRRHMRGGVQFMDEKFLRTKTAPNDDTSPSI